MEYDHESEALLRKLMNENWANYQNPGLLKDCEAAVRFLWDFEGLVRRQASEMERLVEQIGVRNKGGLMDERFKLYRKKQLQAMRPYVPGEDLSGVSVNSEDTPEEGGMIAVNAKNEKDQWYVAKKFFIENYERAER